MLQSVLPKPGSVWHRPANSRSPREVVNKISARVGPFDGFLSAVGQTAETVKATDNDSNGSPYMEAESVPSLTSTPIRESVLEEDECGVVNVCIHKHKSRYSVFVDGYETIPNEEGVVMLPAFRAYHRTSTRANRRTTSGPITGAPPSPDTGIVTPVSISVIVEDGERDPAAIEISTVQRTYVQDTVVHTDEFVNRTTLDPSNVSNGAYGNSVLVPYPSRYTRAPYVGIKDVTREKLHQFSKRSGTVSFVVGSIFYGLIMGVSTLGSGGTDVATLSTSLVSGLGLTSDTIFPVVGTLAFGSLLDTFLATGLFAYFASTIFFASTVVSGSAVLTPIAASTAIGRAVYSLLSASATATRPPVRYIYFTLSELVTFLRTLQNEGAQAGQRRDDTLLSYEDRVLLSWMTEPESNVVYAAMGSFFNWVGQKLVYKTPFPSYGHLINAGMNIETLAQYTVETSVMISIVDEQLCDGGMVVVKLSAGREESLKAAAYHSGWLEDFDELTRELSRADVYFTGKNAPIRARRALFGWSRAFMTKLRLGPEDTVETQRVRNGLTKIGREVRALWLPIQSWVSNRDGFVSMPSKSVPLCRLLPFWIKMDSLGTTVRNHTSDVVSHQVEGDDGQVSDGMLQPGVKQLQLTFSSASKTLSNTNEALTFYQNVWSSEKRIRPLVVQFWKNVDMGYPHGVPYLIATRDTYSDNNFEATGIPDDITMRSIGWNRSSQAYDKLMVELVNGSFPDSDLVAANTAAAAAYAKLVVACVVSRHMAREQIAASMSVQRTIDIKRKQILELLDSIVSKIGVHNLCTDEEMFIALPGGGCAFTLLFRLNLLRIDLRGSNYVTFGFSCREFVSRSTVSSQNLLAKYISRGVEPELRKIVVQGRQAFADMSGKRFDDRSPLIPSQALYGLHSAHEAVPRLLSEARETLTTLQLICIGAEITNDNCRRVVLASIESRPVLKLVDLPSGVGSAMTSAGVRNSSDGLPSYDDPPLFTHKQLSVRMASRDIGLPITLPELSVPVNPHSKNDADPANDLADALATTSISRKEKTVYYIPFMEGDGKRTTRPAVHNAPLIKHTVPISLSNLIDVIKKIPDATNYAADASIKDNFVSDSSGLNRTPVDTDPYRITLSYEQDSTHSMRTVHVMMSHCGMQSTAADGARSEGALESGIGPWNTAILGDVIEASRKGTAVSTDVSYFKHDRIQETTLWNAERIVQASLAHASHPEHQDGDSFVVNVFKPMPWTRSRSDNRILNQELQAANSKLRRHEETLQSTIVDYYDKLDSLVKGMQLGTLYERETYEDLYELPAGTTIDDLRRRSDATTRQPGDQPLTDPERRFLQLYEFVPTSPTELSPPELTTDFMNSFVRDNSTERTRLRTRAIQALIAQTYAFDEAATWASSDAGRHAFEQELDRINRSLIDTFIDTQRTLQNQLENSQRRLDGWRAQAQELETSWNGLADQAFFASVVLARCILQQTIGPSVEFQLVGFDGVEIPPAEMRILPRVERGASAALAAKAQWISVGEYCNLCAALCMSIDQESVDPRVP